MRSLKQRHVSPYLHCFEQFVFHEILLFMAELAPLLNLASFRLLGRSADSSEQRQLKEKENTLYTNFVQNKVIPYTFKS